MLPHPLAFWRKTAIQSTLTVSPQPGSGGSNVTCDGRLRRQGVNESFATIRSGAGNSNNESESTLAVFLQASTTTNQYQILARIGMTFNTTTIPASATIDSATLRLYGYDKFSALGTPALVVCAFSPAANNDFVNADYALANWGAEYARVSYASWSTTGYNVISLPDTAITKAGVTRIGLRLSWDFDNSTSGLTWVSNGITGFYFYAADNGTNIPQLVVTYTY